MLQLSFTCHHQSLAYSSVLRHPIPTPWILPSSFSCQDKWSLSESHDTIPSSIEFSCLSALVANELHRCSVLFILSKFVFSDRFIREWCHLLRLWRPRTLHLLKECSILLPRLREKCWSKPKRSSSNRFWSQFDSVSKLWYRGHLFGNDPCTVKPKY